MIREFRQEDSTIIRQLGAILGSSFDLEKCSENERINVYEKDGRVVGFIDYICLYEVVEVLYIVVEESYRRVGIGKKLLLSTIKKETERCVLEVRCSNDTAINFYRNLGFKESRVIKDYFKDGENALAMEMDVK